ncbi:MAG: lip [Frankiales bacterium]|nr:lip [Frankiales bacterium]
MALDPQVQAQLALLPAHVDARSIPIAEHRSGYEQLLELRRGAGWKPEPVGSSVDVDVLGVPCRLHRPEGLRTPHLLVYLHGGGWIVGGLESHEGVARSLCRRAGIAVLAVDYRLAPEHPFPEPLEDCLTVARWAGEQKEFASVSVGGDSAGGNLAAAVALVFRAEGRPLAAQLLVYPVLDATGSPPSYAENAKGMGLEAVDMHWYWEQYAGRHPMDDPLLSPSAVEELAELAPAVVATAGYDVLRDEGNRYAERLREAGVPVWAKQYDGMVHGFFGQGSTVAAADAAMTEIALALKGLLLT